MLVFQDEVHFQTAVTVTRMWVQKGSAPKVKAPSGKDSVAYSGFVRPDTGELFIAKPLWFNYASFLDSVSKFLEVCQLAENQKICLILDNASWHKKAKRLVEDEQLEEYKHIRHKLVFLFLPPYSPDLNPIEQCWRKTRREVTHNTYFPDRYDLEYTLDWYFSKFAQPNESLASLCSFSWAA